MPQPNTTTRERFIPGGFETMPKPDRLPDERDEMPVEIACCKCGDTFFRGRPGSYQCAKYKLQGFVVKTILFKEQDNLGWCWGECEGKKKPIKTFTKKQMQDAQW